MNKSYKVVAFGAGLLIATILLSGGSCTPNKGNGEPHEPNVNTTNNGPVEVYCTESDPDYRFVGGRHLCLRECRPYEYGPNGNLCETKIDHASRDQRKFCDCGV